jgi:hypothetical protein
MMRERLLTDEILTGLARDCDVQGKWALTSEEAAVEELRRRVFIEEGETLFKGIPAATLNIGFKGKVAESRDLDLLAERLMEDVKRFISAPAPEPAPEAPKF